MRSLLLFSLMISNSVFHTVPAHAQKNPEARIEKSLNDLLGFNSDSALEFEPQVKPQAFAHFKARIIGELKADKNLYAALIAESKGLKKRVEQFLILELKRALTSATFPADLLPGLARFASQDFSGDDFPEDAADRMSKKISTIAVLDQTRFEMSELVHSLTQPKDMARVALAILQKDPHHEAGIAIFKQMTNLFAPRGLSGEAENLSLVKTVIDAYPKWDSHLDQEYLFEFWLRYFNFSYQMNGIRLSYETQVALNKLEKKLPARERLFFFAISRDYDGKNKYKGRIQTAKKAFYLNEGKYWNGDYFEELYKDSGIDLSPRGHSKDLVEFIRDRARLMQAGEYAPIGIFLFDQLLEQNPVLAKEIAPAYFEHDHWTFLQAATQGIPALRGTGAYLLGGMTQNSEVAELQRWESTNRGTYDADKAQKLTDYFVNSNDPRIAQAKANVTEALWKSDRIRRWVLREKGAFQRLFPDNNVGRARTEFLCMAESPESSSRSDHFYKYASVYFRELLNRGKFKSEFLLEPYLRKSLLSIDWSKLPDLVEPMLTAIEKLPGSWNPGAGEKLALSMTYSNLLKVSIQKNSLARAVIEERIILAIDRFNSDLQMLSKQDFNEAVQTLFTFADEGFTAQRSSAKALMEGFQRFKLWMEVVAMKYDFAQNRNYTFQVQKFQVTLQSKFPKFKIEDGECNQYYAKALRGQPDTGGLFNFGSN